MPPLFAPVSYNFDLFYLNNLLYNLMNLNLNKSGGPDNVPPRLIKEFAYELCFPLAEVFNCSLNAGAVPDLWKKAIVVPVPTS